MEDLRQLNIHVSASLIKSVRKQAIEDDRTVREVVTDAIQDYLKRSKADAKARKSRTKSPTTV